MDIMEMLFGNSGNSNINGMDFEKIVASNPNTLILDVRSPGEFMSGHIPGAVNLPVQELSRRVDTLEEYINEDIIIYCASGARSASASQILKASGFNKIYNLLGGVGSYRGQLRF